MLQDIVAVSLNPTLDVSLWVEKLDKQEPVQAKREKIFPGGRAVNVVRVLNSLHVPSHLIGIAGNENVLRFYRLLEKDGISYDFIPVEGAVRENISVTLPDDTVYTIGRTGFSVPDEAFAAFQQKLKAALSLKNSPVAVFSGSLPGNVRKEQYVSLMRDAKAAGALLCVDTAICGEKDVRELRPFLIKPNAAELSQIVGQPINGVDQAAFYAKKLSGDVTHVLVSMGQEGLLYAGCEGCIYAKVPSVPAKSSVGAGDTAMAAFLTALKEGKSTAECLRFSAAAGTASVMLEGTGAVKREEINQVLPRVRLSRM